MTILFHDEGLADSYGWSTSSNLVRGLVDDGRYIDAVKAALLEGDLRVALLAWDWGRPEEHDERTALFCSPELREEAVHSVVGILGLDTQEATWREVFEELEATLVSLAECQDELAFVLVDQVASNRASELPLGVAVRGEDLWGPAIEACRDQRSPGCPVNLD